MRERDQRCAQCGTQERLTCGHVFSRVAYSTRWDPENALAQCMGHNLRHEHDPYPFLELAREKLGAPGLDALHARYSQPRKYTTAELAELLLQIKGRQAPYDL